MTTVGLDLEQIRYAVRDQLLTRLDGLASCYSHRVMSPAYPAVTVMPGPMTYRATMDSSTALGSMADTQWILKVETSAADDISAQIAMDRMLSRGNALSVFDALAADHTLGGQVNDCTASVTNTPEEDADGHYVAEITIRILQHTNPN